MRLANKAVALTTGNIMKVNRQKISESYKTTVDWVKDFQSNLIKNSSVDPYGSVREKFSTIEDKMEDLKIRTGFDKMRLSKEASSCQCKTCDACKGKESDSLNLQKIIQVLKIVDLILKQEPNLTHPRSIINRCKEYVDDYDLIQMDEHSLVSKIMEKLKKRNLGHDTEKDPVADYKATDFSDGISDIDQSGDENTKTPFSS